MENEWPEGMMIVNRELECPKAPLIDPLPFGYIHLAVEIERPHPLKRSSAAKKAALTKIASSAWAVADQQSVRRVDVFDAIIIPPGANEGRKVLAERGYDVTVAAFDVVVLVECDDPDAALSVRDADGFRALEVLAGELGTEVHCVVMENARRIESVSKETQGVYLFNYFFAADLENKANGKDILLGVWEYTAGWFTTKANLTNSTLFLPLEGQKSQYSVINHCRWDKMTKIVPHLVFRPTIKKFVLANFTANDIVAMPILYHLVMPG